METIADPSTSHARMPLRNLTLDPRAGEAHQNQSGQETNKCGLLLILEFSCSEGLILQLLEPGQQSVEILTGCTEFKEEQVVTRTWLAELHSPGICSELIMASSRSGLGRL